MTALLRQVTTIVHRDLVIEGRAREVASVIGPLAAGAVFVVPFAVDRLTVDLATVGRPVFWLVTYLFGMQVALRQAASESRSQRRHLALAGLDPLARLLARTASSSLLMGGTVIVTLPLTVLFYGVTLPRWWMLVPALTLFVIGLSVVATLAGEVTAGLAGRTMLAPLIVIPLGIPLLVGGNSAWEAVVRGESTLTPTLMLTVAACAGLAAMAISARPLEEATT